jgi:transposase
MATEPAPATFSDWLAEADVSEHRLGAEQVIILRAAHRFRQGQGADYYSTRLLGHFLLHADTGLKVAQIARLLNVSRPTASRQQGLSSRQAIQQAHHRMDGRPYGKLLPRFAGPIAAFLVKSPDASRGELIDFVERTFGVRVSRTALYKFLGKYGLNQIPATPDAKAVAPPSSFAQEQPSAPMTSLTTPQPAPPFSSPARSTPAPSC